MLQPPVKSFFAGTPAQSLTVNLQVNGGEVGRAAAVRDLRRALASGGDGPMTCSE